MESVDDDGKSCKLGHFICISLNNENNFVKFNYDAQRKLYSLLLFVIHL